MHWQVSASVVFVCVAVGSFIYKRAQIQGIRPGSFMLVQSFCFLVLVSLASLLWGENRFDHPCLRLGALCGIIGFVGAFTSLTSMKTGELGTNIAVIRLSFLPTTLGAILLLGEAMTLRKGLLFVLASLAVLLFFDHYRKTNRSAIASLVPALIACLAFGVFDLVYKIAAMCQVDPFAFVIVQSATAHFISHGYVVLREDYRINRVILKAAPASAVMFGLACLAWLVTLRSVDVSLAAPFLQMNFILTYLLGVVFLRESITRRKLIGIALVAGSVLILSDRVFLSLTRWGASLLS